MSFHLVEHLAHHLALKHSNTDRDVFETTKLHIFVVWHHGDLNMETERSLNVKSEEFFRHQACQLRLVALGGTSCADSRKILCTTCPMAFHEDPDGSPSQQLDNLRTYYTDFMQNELGTYVSPKDVAMPFIMTHISNLCTFPYPSSEELNVQKDAAFCEQ